MTRAARERSEQERETQRGAARRWHLSAWPLRGRANRRRERLGTSEAVARAARERSEQERETQRGAARRWHLSAWPLSPDAPLRSSPTPTDACSLAVRWTLVRLLRISPTWLCGDSHRHQQNRYADIVTRRAWTDVPSWRQPVGDRPAPTTTARLWWMSATRSSRVTGPTELGEFIDRQIQRFDLFHRS